MFTVCDVSYQTTAQSVLDGWTANVWGGGPYVSPILVPYSPSPLLVFDPSMIDFSGTLRPLPTFGPGSGYARVGIDPTNGLQQILFSPDVGGFTWQYDGVTPLAPVKIYGWCIIDLSNNQLVGVYDPLAQPLQLNGPSLVTFGEAGFDLIPRPFQ